MDILEYWFNNFSIQANRIETRDHYAIYDTNEYEEYIKYTKGEKIYSYANIEWLDTIRNAKNRNKIITRIRVIPDHITEYFRYEFNWCYPKNMEAGEEIGFICNDEYKSIIRAYGLDINDIWIFDQKIAICLLYNSQDEYIGCKELKNTQQKLILEIYEDLMEKMISYNEVKDGLWI